MPNINPLVQYTNNVVRNKSKISYDDCRSLLQEAIRLGGNKITTNHTKALLFIRRYYWTLFDNKAKKMLCDFEKASFADLPDLREVALSFRYQNYVKDTDTNKLSRSHLFFGQWINSTYMSSGGMNLTINHYRFFGPDGRFMEGSRSLSTSTYYNSSGQWTGWGNASTAYKPSDRGSWGVDCTSLLLNYDNNTFAEYIYELSGTSLLLHNHKGKEQFWRRY